jgi:histidinol phosphatase-like enzyme
MLRAAADDWPIDLPGSWMIGDRWVDIGAGREAGVEPLLIGRPFSWAESGGTAPPPDLEPTATLRDLEECVEYVLGTDRRRR